ncbi:hypothetical protein [Gemmatimonas sp.]|uniref:hypothetical protein n=1 Tax=Gemmatimonas sp. TaxID=1962908 RepID=UPI0022C8F26F|nr:hypothetical protein [Gemmatimonas sp.]MCZ8204499.1 hypothetical protein [Gemmatimonas sp.]
MSIEEVRALVAERQRYDEWLAALEAKRAETPARVFERVHGDYVGRRAGVLTQLQAHVGALATSGGELEQRLGDLEGRLSSLGEELAEGMLRNLVGEYDHQRWDAVRQDIEARIGTLGQERGALLAEVEEVRALLANARVEPFAVPTVEPSAEPSAEPSVHVAAGQNVASVPTPVVTLSPEPTPLAGLAVDAERAATESEAPLLDIHVSGIVDNPVPAADRHEDVLADVAALFNTSSIAAVPAPKPAVPLAPSAPQLATPALSTEAVAQQAEVDHALAMFGTATGPADTQFVQSLQGIEPEHDTRMERSTATATPKPAPNAADPFDDLAFLRSVIDPKGAAESAPPVAAPFGSAAAPAASAEPQKTLRCTECSTMNLPTEWYCERCGGELAAF